MSDSRALFLDHFGHAPGVTARAPGRVEFVGNHTDYNGGEVIGSAIDRYLSVSVSRRKDQTVELISRNITEPVRINLTEFSPLNDKNRWTNYPIGVLNILRDAGLRVISGFNLAVYSEIPDGAGLGSSAAFELATALALCDLFSGLKLDMRALVKYCRKAENEFVGMPCGLLDQGVSGFGKRNHLIRIDCKLELYSTISVPEGMHFWIFNSHKKHSLVDSLYEKRHRECSDAFDVLRRSQLGAGCLCDIDPLFVELAHYRMPPDVFRRARHITEEHQRVKLVAEALSRKNLKRVGELLYASHESSRSLFHNSCEELDFLVYQLRLQNFVYGARLSGGGFGGVVLALTSDRFTQAQADEVCERFEERFDVVPSFLHVQTADGATVI